MESSKRTVFTSSSSYSPASGVTVGGNISTSHGAVGGNISLNLGGGYNRTSNSAVNSGSNFTSSGHIVRQVESTTSTNTISMKGAKLFAAVTEREKKEMQELNERLSNYIARVKILEEQNRSLVASLTDLRGKWGSKNASYKTTISETYQGTRTDVDNSIREKERTQVGLARVKSDIAEYKTRIEEIGRAYDGDRTRIGKVNGLIADANGELDATKKKLAVVLSEERLALEEQERLWRELDNLKSALDNEMVERMTNQSRLSALRNEVEFLKRVHECEVRELSDLLVLAPADTKDFFRNELALAVRDIKKEYDLMAQVSKTEIEKWYSSKLTDIKASADSKQADSELQTVMLQRISSSMAELKSRYSQLEGENVRLEREVSGLQSQVTAEQIQFENALRDRENQLTVMREDCSILVAELQSLLHTKQTLDAEIAIYRALVEGEERRVGVTHIVTDVEEDHSNQWEVATKTKFQTHAHGNIAIAQCEPTGRFILLENTSKYHNEHLDGWHLKRILDEATEFDFYFPAGTVIHAGSKLRIIGRGQGVASKGVIVYDKPSWGMGSNVVTTLFNQKGEERAVYTQRTVVASSP